MNKSLVLSIASFAILFQQGIAVAADLFDSPGPGYRQQIDRVLSPQKVRAVSFRVQAPSDILFGAPLAGASSARPLSAGSLLDQPIRLTLAGAISAITK